MQINAEAQTLQPIHPEPTSFLRKYVFSTDHKVIAKQFLFTGLFFLLFGGMLAMLIRWQWAYPGQEVPLLGQLFFARWQGQVLAGVFATFLGRKGWYKDGGSLKEHADVMAPHLLQWEVMRWLRTRGVRSYDLVAVPAHDQLREDHPLWGLYRFKSGFSERISEFVGTWDLPVSRIRYGAWSQVAERAYHQWAYRVRHDLFY